MLERFPPIINDIINSSNSKFNYIDPFYMATAAKFGLRRHFSDVTYCTITPITFDNIYNNDNNNRLTRRQRLQHQQELVARLSMPSNRQKSATVGGGGRRNTDITLTAVNNRTASTPGTLKRSKSSGNFTADRPLQLRTVIHTQPINVDPSNTDDSSSSSEDDQKENDQNQGLTSSQPSNQIAPRLPRLGSSVTAAINNGNGRSLKLPQQPNGGETRRILASRSRPKTSEQEVAGDDDGINDDEDVILNDDDSSCDDEAAQEAERYARIVRWLAEVAASRVCQTTLPGDYMKTDTAIRIVWNEEENGE